jgi:hypothetical protein
MKTNITKRIALAAVLPLLFTLQSCHVHETVVITDPPCYDGYPGSYGASFYGLQWVEDKPDYLWTNNQAIPHIFEYGVYYQTTPGRYELYYEGEFVEDCCPKFYAWDVAFDIWSHAGTPGGCGFNGVNGLDSYVMFTCGPYGPIESRMNKTAADPRITILSQTDDLIVAELKDDDITMKITYTRVEVSRKAQLDPKGVIIAKE